MIDKDKVQPGRHGEGLGPCNAGYPMVNVYITMKHQSFVQENSIYIAIFNGKLIDYQRRLPAGRSIGKKVRLISHDVLLLRYEFQESQYFMGEK